MRNLIISMYARLKAFFLSLKAVILEPVVIIHSPFKTGTTTVGAALVTLGVGNEDHGFHRELNRRYGRQIDAANLLALESPSFAKFKKRHAREIRLLLGELLKHARGYQVFGDVPFGHLRIHPFVKKLLMPNSKFIWIDRNEDAWLISARKWQLTHPDVYPNSEKLWHADPKAETDKLIRMREDGFAEFKRLANEFPGDCLVLSLENDARWEPLCKFFNLPVPQASFPVLNKAMM